MTAPITPLWASDALTDNTNINGVDVTYQNRLQPPVEIQTVGILAKTPLTLGHLNYQFYTINTNLDYLKTRHNLTLITNSGTTRTYAETDGGKYIRFTSADPTTYTINAGVAAIGDRIEIRQAGAGVVTLTQGTGTVLFKCKTGFLPKTSGIDTSIIAIKTSEEVWDISGDMGV